MLREYFIGQQQMQVMAWQQLVLEQYFRQVQFSFIQVNNQLFIKLSLRQHNRLQPHVQVELHVKLIASNDHLVQQQIMSGVHILKFIEFQSKGHTRYEFHSELKLSIRSYVQLICSLYMELIQVDNQCVRLFDNQLRFLLLRLNFRERWNVFLRIIFHMGFIHE